MKPDVSGLMPGIVFRFPVVRSSDGSCEEVIIEDEGSGSEIYRSCLTDIDMSDEGVFAPLSSDGIRVDFVNSNVDEYGFITKFDSGL